MIEQHIQQHAVIFDVRSEGEYASGHVPGALNLPLLNNEERHAVGICYKEKGDKAAVHLGFQLTGHKFHEYISKAQMLANGGPVLVYCWRGGLRSNIMCWLLRTAGMEVTLLEGGYKAWRNRVHQAFAEHGTLMLLSGKTGTKKTLLLQAMKNTGAAVVDLEALAKHKGSAFGALGEEEGPTQEHFENLLGSALLQHSSTRTIWLEDESRYIGPLHIPDVLYKRMQVAGRVLVERPYALRHAYILEEYGKFSKEALRECTLHLKKRMGFDRVQEAVHFLEEGNMDAWLDGLLKYYDTSYDYSFGQLQEVRHTTVVWNEESVQEMAKVVLSKEENGTQHSPYAV